MVVPAFLSRKQRKQYSTTNVENNFQSGKHFLGKQTDSKDNSLTCIFRRADLACSYDIKLIKLSKSKSWRHSFRQKKKGKS